MSAPTKPANLARAAVSGALRLRHRAGVALTDPASPIDIAERIGVQVSFLRTPSMEGMFIQAPHPQVILSSMRPTGRINFTCAHELGHHWFGHEAHVDLASTDEPLLLADEEDEFQANSFASALLMPKTTVQHGFVARGADPRLASPRLFLAVAHWLGVGYATLVHHSHRVLHLIDSARAKVLLKETPKKIVEPELESAPTGSTFVVDRAWKSRPLDMQVGDLAIVDGELRISGACVRVHSKLDERTVIEAVSPGTGHLDLNPASVPSSTARRRRMEPARSS